VPTMPARRLAPRALATWRRVRGVATKRVKASNFGPSMRSSPGTLPRGHPARRDPPDAGAAPACPLSCGAAARRASLGLCISWGEPGRGIHRTMPRSGGVGPLRRGRGGRRRPRRRCASRARAWRGGCGRGGRRCGG